MTPSIYDMKDNEIENARRICRERRWAIVEAVVGVPVLAVVAWLWVVLCALM